MSSKSPRRKRYTPASQRLRSVARWMFHGHLWIGVVATFLVLAVSVTGIMLNHKQFLGYMPETEYSNPDGFGRSLPLTELVNRANTAVPPAVAEIGVDRMDVRPDKGLVKVRYDDPDVHEVTVALDNGEILASGLRNDVFLEKLHSGEIFGDAWILLSDFAAVALILLLVTGVWMWLYPRGRQT